MLSNCSLYMYVERLHVDQSSCNNECLECVCLEGEFHHIDGSQPMPHQDSHCHRHVIECGMFAAPQIILNDSLTAASIRLPACRSLPTMFQEQKLTSPCSSLHLTPT